MKTNYRIQNACPNCIFSLRKFDVSLYCNKDKKYNPKLDIMNDREHDMIWEWEDSHSVFWCGICSDYERVV